MLNKLQNIRAVLEQAVELELAGAGSALLDFKEVHSKLLDENADDDLQDYQIGEGVAHG
tara:strand:+ start:780 stop:956 length:177 start_codon:yes stop_codon:yes gene_type:complete